MINALPLPPFIEYAEDTNGVDHLNNCLAWWKVKNKPMEIINEWLDRLDETKPSLASDMRVRVDQCIAWLYLVTMKREDIVILLDSLPENQAKAMRQHLNDLKQQVKQFTKGETDGD